MVRTFPTAASRIAAIALMASLAGCATTRMNAEWKNLDFPARPLKGSKVLVMCQSRDDTQRRVCEDRWAAQLGARGIAAVRSYQIAGFPPGGQANPDEVKAAARSSGAVAVLSSQLAASDIAVVNPGPSIGFGLGGGSYGGAVGVGVSVPVGGATATRGLAANTSLVDAATGTMVWSGTATTPASGDVAGQVSALTQITAEAMQGAGVL